VRLAAYPVGRIRTDRSLLEPVLGTQHLGQVLRIELAAELGDEHGNTGLRHCGHSGSRPVGERDLATGHRLIEVDTVGLAEGWIGGYRDLEAHGALRLTQADGAPQVERTQCRRW
jgi:hypothetical protein